MADTVAYTVRVHDDPDGLWAEVIELPGCFATGDTMDELWQDLEEGMSTYLSAPGHRVRVKATEKTLIGRKAVREERRQFELCPA